MQGRTMDALPLRTDGSARQRWFLVALCAFFLAINVQYVLKVANSEREHRSAFLRWATQIVYLDDGVNIWERFNYPNPPIMALILAPFVYLPPLAGALLWFYAKVVMAILSIHWVLTLLDSGPRPFPFWGKALAVLLSLRPIEGDLVHGNVNLLILFLVVATVWCFCKHRDVLAGVLLGLAIACKVTPLLMVPYFAWKRAWKTLAGTAVGLALFVAVVPGVVLGWANNQQFFASWWENMVQPYAVEGKITSEHPNQSLPGVLQRLLTHNPSFVDFPNDVWTPTEYHNVVALDEAVVRWLVKGCMGVFALCVLWRCRTPITDRTDWRLLAEFSVVALGMLLFSERTWKHHAVTLLLPFAVLAYQLSALRPPRATRNAVIATLVVSVALMTLTSSGLFDKQDRIGDLAQVYGAYLWAFLLLTASMFAALGRRAATSSTAALPEPSSSAEARAA
jgi:hypothetical protein